ncbi:MAG: hypothetical protein ABJB47_21340, partial [Actinomycetota bacterium]
MEGAAAGSSAGSDARSGAGGTGAVPAGSSDPPATPAAPGQASSARLAGRLQSRRIPGRAARASRSPGAHGGGLGSVLAVRPAGPRPAALWPAVQVLLRGTVGAAQARCAAALGAVRAQWSRSLQLRVVGTTLFISAAVIATLGFFLLQQIAGGLVQEKEKSAATLAAEGVRTAESQLDTKLVLPSDGGANGLMYDILLALPQERNAGAGTAAAVMINEARGQDANVLGWYLGPYRKSGIPAKLIAQVEKDQLAGNSQASSEPTTLVEAGTGGQTIPGLAIGAPLGRFYQLYYLFPLQSEQQTLALVQRAIVAVGLAL